MTKSKKRDRVVRLRVRCGAESGSWLKSWRCGVDWFSPLSPSLVRLNSGPSAVPSRHHLGLEIKGGCSEVLTARLSEGHQRENGKGAGKKATHRVMGSGGSNCLFGRARFAPGFLRDCTGPNACSCRHLEHYRSPRRTTCNADEDQTLACCRAAIGVYRASCHTLPYAFILVLNGSNHFL